MSEHNKFLNYEDYIEPRCLLDMSIIKSGENASDLRIPTDRIIRKLDHYLDTNDLFGAERHMQYWLGEAKLSSDRRGELEVLNELTGIYRMLGKENEALYTADRAIEIIEQLSMGNEISTGTIFLNCATVYKRFGQPGKALNLYRQTCEIYTKYLSPDDAKFGALYNNMALALVDIERYGDASELFRKAITVMSKVKGGDLEVAITYLNMADAALIEQGAEAAENLISEYVEKAEICLDNPDLPRNSHYAFVCEKCAAAFGYHGYFMIQQDMEGRAKEIYERTRAGTPVL